MSKPLPFSALQPLRELPGARYAHTPVYLILYQLALWVWLVGLRSRVGRQTEQKNCLGHAVYQPAQDIVDNGGVDERANDH